MCDQSISLSKRDPHAVLEVVTRALESLVAEPADSVALTLPLQIEADSADELVLRLVNDVNEVLADERRSLVSLEFGGMMKVGTGFRMWGTIQLGTGFITSAVPVRIDASVHDGCLHLQRRSEQQ